MKSTEFLTESPPPSPHYTKLYAIAWQTGKVPALPLIKSTIPDFMVDSVFRDLKQTIKAKKAIATKPQLAIDLFSSTLPTSGKQIDQKIMFGKDYTLAKSLHDDYWQAIWDKEDAKRAAEKPVVKKAPKIPASLLTHLDKIQTECSDILKLYKANPNTFFYRGIGTTKPLLTGQSQYRDALHTPQEIHQGISDAMKAVGFTAIRNNSIFAVSYTHLTLPTKRIV